ncbi:glutathione S-transferase family protein [Phenylobacterium sp.]|uniref:glutathione S-transferase family protein n=1 Tax=Phenylobacterium sp. TaxID=1871053 RepID=UPI002ED7A66A
MIAVYSYKWVPDFARGLVRDLRVRWALEEAGLPYEQRLISVGPEQSTPQYRALQPYGQVPAYVENDLTLFESGAIALHIAEKSEVLLPRDPKGRARAICWLFSALNTVEPPVQDLTGLDLFFEGQPWKEGRRASVEPMARRRLAELAAALGDKEYLEGRFTVGDLMMVTVLQIPRHTDLVAAHPNLAAYVARCEARPAYQRALKAQLESFQAEPEMA